MLISQARGVWVKSQPLLLPKLDLGPTDIILPGPLLRSPHPQPNFTSSHSIRPGHAPPWRPPAAGSDLLTYIIVAGNGEEKQENEEIKEGKKKKKKQDRQANPPSPVPQMQSPSSQKPPWSEGGKGGDFCTRH